MYSNLKNKKNYTFIFVLLLINTQLISQSLLIENNFDYETLLFEFISNNSLQSSEKQFYENKNSEIGKTSVVKLRKDVYNNATYIIHYDPNTEEIVSKKSHLGTKLLIKVTDIQMLTNGQGYVWLADIFKGSSDIRIGHVQLTSYEDVFQGHLDINGTIFNIEPLGKSNNHIIFKPNQNIVISCGTRHSSNIDLARKKNINTNTSITPCYPNVQKLMVLYTTAAKNAVPNIASTINTAVSETNIAYLRSDIYNIILELVHYEEIPFFSEHGSYKDATKHDLNSLVANTQIKQIRDSHKADIVILLVSQGDITGLAKDIPAQNLDDSYAVANVNAITAPNYVLAHEIGHLQGAQHSPNDPTLPTGPNGPWSYGYGHQFIYDNFFNITGKRRHTIMSNSFITGLSPDPSIRIQNFSNPDVYYHGERTGTATRDNARVLEMTANTVSKLRDANELGGRITTNILSQGYYQLNAETCGSNGNYSFEWSFGTSPGVYGNVYSTSQSFNKLFVPGFHYIKLKILTSLETIERYYTLYVDPIIEPCIPLQDVPCVDDPIPKTKYIENPISFALQDIYPNPFNGSVSKPGE